MTSREKKNTTLKNNQSKKRKNQKRKSIKKNRGGYKSVILDSLVGVAEKNVNDDLTNSNFDQECYRRKFSNIQHCIDQGCVNKLVGNIKTQSTDDTKIKALQRENQKLRNTIKQLYYKYDGLNIHDFMFCQNKKKKKTFEN
tara:strand:- start:6908 stop:7330 length:423 start_codon:yes stop_codon:yes gene_type:complete